MSLIGARVERREDARLLTGRGRYVADLARPHMATAVVLRSPHAHARICALDTRRARAVPGVLDCITGADVGEVPPLPPRLGVRPALAPLLQRPFPRDRVRYVGEPVAVVVATDRAGRRGARLHRGAVGLGGRSRAPHRLLAMLHGEAA